MEKVGWCQNSRIWIGVSPYTPDSCPYKGIYGEGKCCDNCGYYEERKPTPYLIRKLKILRGLP